MLSCNAKTDSHQKTKSAVTNTSFKLTVDRGAFHYDKFILTRDSIFFVPQSDTKHEIAKYNARTEKLMNSAQTLAFFNEIEKRGFWKLENHYSEHSTCLSQLTITLEAEGKSKTVICDDFKRGCSDLIKYIDQKVVELQGNNLKRIYLPG